ncbi:zonular occludens toxin domain-containing protein, partial [Xenophilus sp. Marseille-Q4582]|uniref:zonular occludens toxin domain-containing protein n=1 Tax=Xenophilus sp. Marseille-Q4582 TaxID=2866600 RepID=UPI001CE42B71
MLYLRTGANGSCKSLFTLEDVRAKQLKELRPVCVIIGKPAHGTEPEDRERRYLKIKPEIMKEFGWTECHYSDWWAQPNGTIFLADECHNWLPKRANGSAVPEYVSKLAEHRSRGFDFFMLTQHPSNIDSFVVKLIGAPGWHQHLKRVAGGSSVTSVIQFDAVNLQCEKAGAGRSGQVTMRGQPKEVYGWYDSAELHTGKVRIPRAAVFLAVSAVLIPVMLGGAGYMLWKQTIGKAGEEEVAAVAEQSAAPGAAVAGSSGRSGGNGAKGMTTSEYILAHRPRIEGLRHTAPVYDELTKPVRVSVPAACMSMGDRCKCYTQDATIYQTTDDICRQIVKNGLWLDFDPNGTKGTSNVGAQPVRANGPVAAPVPEPSPGLIVIGEPVKGSTREPKVATVDAQSSPRVPKSSPWSFQTGG